MSEVFQKINDDLQKNCRLSSGCRAFQIYVHAFSGWKMSCLKRIKWKKCSLLQYIWEGEEELPEPEEEEEDEEGHRHNHQLPPELREELNMGEPGFDHVSNKLMRVARCL